MNKKSTKIITLISIVVIIAAALLVNPAAALVSQSTQWFTGSDTKVSAVAIGDVNGDTQNEIVTVGYCNNGVVWTTELYVRNAATMNVMYSTSWNSVGNTQINSVAIGDVNNDGTNEIVTGGAYFDGTRWNSQLIVWNGATLNVLAYTAWFSSGNTEIAAVAIGDVNGAAPNEIVTGGALFYNGNWNAQLIVWNGATANLSVLAYTAWLSTGNTQINSVAIGDVNGAAPNEIVTGGTYLFNGNWNAQLIVWNGATANLNVLGYAAWVSVGSTMINSVAIGDVNGVAPNDIVTAGTYFDNVHWNAQLIVWNGATASPSVLAYNAWNTIGDTRLTSVAVGAFTTGATGLDIFTGGTFFDGTRTNAQLGVWAGPTLASRSLTQWFTTSNTEISTVAFGNLNGANRIVTGGSFYDNIRSNAQLAAWT